MKQFITLLLCIGLFTNGHSPFNKSETSDVSKESSKEIVKKAMDALFKDFDEKAMRIYFHKDYIQHNPYVPTGLEPVIGLLPVLKKAGFGYKTHRMIQDGDLILTHTTYYNADVFGAKTVVAFDIWRVKNGKVTEHWDAIIPKFDKTVSGRTQTGGVKSLEDFDKTAENKALAKNFVPNVLIKEDFSKMGNYIKNNLYDQHNPKVGDGPKALQDIIAVSGLKNSKIHRVIGEGNFVLTQSEGSWNGKPQAIYDLFRLENGAIVEHWDVIQEIPNKMAHKNGMF